MFAATCYKNILSTRVVNIWELKRSSVGPFEEECYLIPVWHSRTLAAQQSWVFCHIFEKSGLQAGNSNPGRQQWNYAVVKSTACCLALSLWNMWGLSWKRFWLHQRRAVTFLDRVHMLLLLWITKLVDNMEKQFLEVILSLCRYFHDIIMALFNAVPL